MKNWTISKRITIGFAILSLITIAVGLTGFISLRLVGNDAEILVSDSMPSALIMGQVKDNLSRGYANIEKFIRATNAKVKNDAKIIYDKLSASNTSLYADYEKLLNTEEDKKQYQALLEIRKAYAQMLTKLFELEANGDIAATYTYLDDTFIPQYRIYRDAIDGILGTSRDESVSIGENISGNTKSANITIISAILLGIALAVTIAFVIIRGTNKVLEKAITSIDEGSTQVAAAASQVSAASNMLAEGASEQAASLEETSSSLEEMSSMTSHNAQSATKAKTLADDMHSAADSSAEQMHEMQKAMDAIKESSAGISQIIKTIDEIAFQTNILALNAAVEAARAGEAGAGFAVVAEEVRNLAQRSAQSAKETSGKIEGAIRNSDHGVAISARVAESLTQIVDKARAMNALVSEIANASQEQDKGIGQLTTAVQQMDKVTQSNASNAEETASASEELNAHADGLKETVIELVALVRNDVNTSMAAASTSRVAARSVKTSFRAASPVRSTTAKSPKVADGKAHFLPMHDDASGKA